MATTSTAELHRHNRQRAKKTITPTVHTTKKGTVTIMPAAHITEKETRTATTLITETAVHRAEIQQEPSIALALATETPAAILAEDHLLTEEDKTNNKVR